MYGHGIHTSGGSPHNHLHYYFSRGLERFALLLLGWGVGDHIKLQDTFSANHQVSAEVSSKFQLMSGDFITTVTTVMKSNKELHGFLNSDMELKKDDHKGLQLG